MGCLWLKRNAVAGYLTYMKVLTFGWDFPPQTTGGLGIACHGLTKELVQRGIEVVFVLPRTQPVIGPAHFIFADVEHKIRVRTVGSALQPYGDSNMLIDVYDETGTKKLYSRSIIEEAQAYAKQAAEIALEEDFDVIHAHDWTAFLAGVAAKIATGKPLVLHVHATAYDQAASEHVDPKVWQIEKDSYDQADRIIAISNFTRDMIVEKYGVDPNKVDVIHNGIEVIEPPHYEPILKELKEQGKKVVLYHGRITIQKGVDYFVRAARTVVDHNPDVIFIISGTGDMERQIMDQVAALGLSQNVRFAGPLWYEDRDRMYQSVDLVVMPSVSEPFGLVPLESMQHGTPALISKQSGVSEVVSHVLKVDFWDTDEMANQILASLRYPVLHQQLVHEGKLELVKLSWQKAATKVASIYQRLVQYAR